MYFFSQATQRLIIRATVSPVMLRDIRAKHLKFLKSLYRKLFANLQTEIDSSARRRTSLLKRLVDDSRNKSFGINKWPRVTSLIETTLQTKIKISSRKVKFRRKVLLAMMAVAERGRLYEITNLLYFTLTRAYFSLDRRLQLLPTFKLIRLRKCHALK